MKTKHTIILLIFGYCLDFLGGLFKIMHQRGADMILTVAAILKICGALLFLYKLVTYPKWRDFLNS
jgi:hypothetical protein